MGFPSRAIRSCVMMPFTGIKCLLYVGTRKRNGPSFQPTAKALHRPKEEVLRYFGLSFRTPTKFDEQDRACLEGKFTNEELHEVFRQYIEDFVLCEMCK